MQSGKQTDDWAATAAAAAAASAAATATAAQTHHLPYMSANNSGPVDPHEFYQSFSSDASATSPVESSPRGYEAAARSYSQSPERARHNSGAGLLTAGVQHLQSVKSQPVLSSRPPARVKDLADKFDQEIANGLPTNRIPNEKYRRQLPRASGQKSPPRKRAANSTYHTPSTSFEAPTSFSSDGTIISTQSQPARKPQPRQKDQPLFGELTSDGQWNGNFDFSNYSPTDYFSGSRRGSDGDLALGRRHSQTDLYHPGYTPVATLSHKRSQSDMTALHTTNLHRQPDSPDVPHLATSLQRAIGSPPTPHPSRIPVRGRLAGSSPSTPGTPRSASALPVPTSRVKPFEGKENAASTNTHSKRYNPPVLPPSQLLSAKIVAPPPKVSPPLRSSRPRQPVSSATTAASRARAANAQPSPISPTTKRPSEQWLGKPYDPKEERSKRKIPQLGKVDFAERRARIQRAISQNLGQSQSLESLRSRSRAASRASNRPTTAGADQEKNNVVDQHQAAVFNQETDDLGLASVNASARQSLSVDTSNLPQPSAAEDIQTAATEFTEFEFEESPTSTRTVQPTAQTSIASVAELPLLSAGVYQPPAKKKTAEPKQETQIDPPVPTANDSWELNRSLADHGSIKIMLDNNSDLSYLDQLRAAKSQQVEPANHEEASSQPSANLPIDQDDDSPIDPGLRNSASKQSLQARASAPKQPELQNDSFVLRAINTYRNTGVIPPEFLHDIDAHSIDLYRISANGGTDAAVVQNLLNSIATQHMLEHGEHSVELQDEPIATPHTPASAVHPGTALVYDAHSYEATPERRSQDAVLGSDDEDEWAAQIRRADEQWERQQRGEGPMFQDDDKPQPPPKDEGYTPHSSIGPTSNLATTWISSEHHDAALERLSGRDASSKNVDSVISEEAVIAASVASPPPGHATPLPPPTLPYGMQDSPILHQTSPEHFGRQSPRMRKTFSGVGSTSSRPSFDSQRQVQLAPASQSFSSFGESTKVGSSDAGGEKSTQTPSPSPEQKRLQKRRHIMRELLDTENTYHQDLKIIEDIYKATVNEIVTPEDKKTLFGNCDDIERFSLQFYDQLRKAVSAMYTPSKNVRWGNRRGSISTTQSDGTGQTSMLSSEPVDEDRDRTTFIGKVFLEHLPRMEQLYGAYLRNHDAANQRLSALQTNPTVKCWLDECHNNASDITSAWDLDSLLVKPTQRVSKYPLILQQLLETTPAEHPDHEALKAAVKDTIAMLTRINDAKKRSDLVEQMISGKRKDTDVRSGLAKAFGRRTERLKERVGISEVFQDAEFDALAQSFGGHYIRLQVTMRDFQDYVNQVDKAIQNTNNIASALELYTDVHQSSLPEIESKWRRYGQVARELTNVSLQAHKAAVQRRVITPLIALIKIHESPQRAINKRKKHIVDYAKCKSIEKRGERPDKKTLEASEMYEALNDQLKIELPKLYDMTAQVVVACLQCFIDSQLEWQSTWERKLKPMLNTTDIPSTVEEIEPAFTADYELVRSRLTELALCNGAILADTANFLAPSFDGDLTKSTSTLESKARITSTGSEAPSMTPVSSKRQSRNETPDIPPAMETPTLPLDTRVRSNSAMSHTTGPTPVTPIAALTAANRPWSNSVTTPPSSAYPTRPSTGTQPHNSTGFVPTIRDSVEQRSRHDSTATYVTAQAEQSEAASGRFSGIFSSAMPPSESADAGQPYARALSPVPSARAADDTKVLFVCASLFEFNIDKARKEAGYPYLTYEQGEVFDVIAQKGELWLAKNQDDAEKNLGWIWEQHFIVLGQD
ncbi:hypothetical protein AMS68_003530 [Peltaster fructicola]|uniref:DH domain-containing protein n=1 Tax=Peltaster fructicola TaxID=286661 RepID=A0A6H0XTG9_9PEZI|nr:hypothetical protein AMS68_003530 [Peltaster fructicola]